MSKNLKNIFLAIGIALTLALFVVSVVFIAIGFDKKDNYFNPESSYLDSTNSYVGGDAYNYIINSGYFSGYVSLGGCFLVGSMVTLSSTAIIYFYLRNNEKKTADQYNKPLENPNTPPVF